MANNPQHHGQHHNGPNWKWTGTRLDHPDAVLSADGRSWTSRTPGGLRIPSKPLHIDNSSIDLDEDLGPAPQPSTFTRRVRPEKRAAEVAFLERVHRDREANRAIESSGGELPVEADEEGGEVAEIGENGGMLLESPRVRRTCRRKARITTQRPARQHEQEAVEEGDVVEAALEAEAASPQHQASTRKPPVRKQGTTRNREKLINPPRQVTSPSPIPLRMDQNMASYHGSRPIPNAIARMRNDIKNHFIKPNGTVRKEELFAKYEKQLLFRTDGRMAAKNPMSEFYMDRRLFSAPMWEKLTMDYVKDHDKPGFRKIRYSVHLRGKKGQHRNFEGELALDVPQPAAWIEDADLPYDDDEDDETTEMPVADGGNADSKDDIDDGMDVEGEDGSEDGSE